MSIRINCGDPLGSVILFNFSDLHEMMLRRIRFDSDVFRLALDGTSIALQHRWLPLLRPCIIKALA